ncbi:GNAT family N-acetyltransferase [Demequina pelophila]|uniref:GNAT family N-acetyltransferase n=1 Tax=Demequina pelophila TaxID=1638984 RepID=UPI0007832FD3|nr:GNAT family protein [Demequina pelophila]
MPFAPLTTDRLVLRPFTAADAEDFAERRSDPETAMYQAWRVPYSVERARDLIASMEGREGPIPGGWYQLDITRTADGRTVGDIAMYLHEHGHTAEIGYTLNPWARRRGYATEAAAAVLDLLVDVTGVHRIEASTHPANERSIAVLERLGFTAEGVRREAFWVEDEVSDDAMFGLLAREWRAHRTAMRL